MKESESILKKKEDFKNLEQGKEVKNQIIKANDLICELMKMNCSVSPGAWMYSFHYMAVCMYLQCGISYEEFLKELSEMAKCYKSRWENQK